MDLSKDQVDGLKDMLERWMSHRSHELEVTFNKDGGIDADSFLKIIRRLKEKGFEEVNSNSDDKLNILCESCLRFTLNSFEDIKEYCNDNKLNNKGWLAIVKKKIEKRSAEDKFRDTINVNEYGICIKTREEHDRGNSDTTELHQDVQKAFEGWANLNKAFRLIRRWSFKKGGVQFDLSMVRSTSSGRNGFNWVKTFNEEKFARNPPTYEIEVELLREDLTESEKTKVNQNTSKEQRNKEEMGVYLNRLITGIGEVLRGIQKNSILIQKSTKRSVISEYLTCAELRAEPPEFRGVKPRTLLLEHMRSERTTGQPNIRDGYNVTDKADGLRVLAFVNKEGYLYMIDMALNVYATGLRQMACANSLLDGEWVTRRKGEESTTEDGVVVKKPGRSTNLLLLFDVYYLNKNKIWNLPFYEKPKEGRVEEGTRHAALAKFIESWGTEPEITIKGYEEKRNLLLNVSAKKFFFGSKEDELSIFKVINNEAFPYNKTRVYHTDGLIFTPNALPLPEKANSPFMEQLKWKPADENTIDFLVMIEKEFNEDKIHYGKNPTTDLEPLHGYKRLVLYVSSREDEIMNDPRKSVLAMRWTREKGKRGGYRAIEFSPMNYIDTLASTSYCERKVDNIQNMDYVTSELGEIIQDGSIVEMRYEPSNEPGWRWIPMRVRYDKTEKFRKAAGGIGNAVKGTMNGEFVANETWNSIYEPITPSMICKGTETPEGEEIEALIKARTNIPRKMVYSGQRKITALSETYMRPMRYFHNDWIKYQLLLKSVLRDSKKEKVLIDMACGKGGDLHKWEKLMPKFVLGIDYAMIDILDKNNGAYNRMLKAILDLGRAKVPDIIFVAGDVTMPIITGEAGRTEEEKKMLRTLFGQNTGGGVPPYVEKMMGVLQNKADVISCMFALHYFFKDKTTFDGFLRNIADCLKVGGYFVGCCFDGDSVFKLLHEVKTGDSYIGKEGEETIWTIRKDYEGTELPTTDDGFGKAITVEFASIGLPHEEYLMPWDLLVAKMDTIGCELVKDPINELGLKASTNLFSASYEMAKDRKYGLEKFPAIEQFSFMNRWFIFKRVTDGKVVATNAPKAQGAPVLLKQGSAPRPGESVGKDLEEEGEDFVRSVKKVEPQATYAPSQVVQFSIEAPITKDDITRKWISLMIPINIPDEKDTKAVYPTIEHFLAGMKYKHFSNQPEKAALFQTTGFYATSVAPLKAAAQTKTKKYYDLLKDQLDLIKRNLVSDKKTVFTEKAESGLFWKDEKMRLLKYALELRLEKDKDFQAMLDKVKSERKYLLSTGAVEPDFNGDFRQRKIVGENKLGKALMELVDYTV